VIPVACAVEGKAKRMEHWAVPDDLWPRLFSLQAEGSRHQASDSERAGVFVYQLPENTSAPSVSLATPLTFLSPVEPRESSLRDYRAWESARLATLAAGGRAEAITTVTALSTAEKPPGLSADVQTMTQRQDRLASLRFGRAVHAALRSAQVSGLTPSRAFNLSAIWNPEEREEIARLVMATLASPIMLRARKAEERFAETPFSLYLSGRLVEGVVDFAFIENGAWVIVDFKTDRVLASEVETRATLYRSQLCLYALALERLTRRPIAELALYFVRPQRTVPLVWDDEAHRLAETLIDSLPPGLREAEE
jgi:ATP-dependent exoDNAse (exonuclease V) beta subunit